MQSDVLYWALAILAVVAILLLVIVKNRKDRKEVEDKLNQDYRKPKKTKSDIETEGADSI